MFEHILNHLQTAVPYAAHNGVVLLDLDESGATAQLPQTASSVNHIATQHAGALFTLGEAASGAAMAGALAPVLMTIRPVTSDASIRYTKIAKGTITAHANIDSNNDELLTRIREDGKTSFRVNVRLTDDLGDEVANMQVQWHVSDSARRENAA
jgi:acyl-coenzyme A thioesterase PaaI-like protein